MIVIEAGASIGKFIMGVIGWYGSARNGVQVIYTDYRAVKSFDRDIEGLKEGLAKQQRRIEAWKMQWLVSEDAPESMFLDFWGEAEYKRIKTTLIDMVASCNLAEKDLKTFMKLDAENWNAMTRIRKIFRFIGVKGEPLRKLLTHIEQAVDGLQDSAKTGWQRNDSEKKGDIDFKAVYHAGVGRLLVPIAMRTRDDADALHGSCRSAQGNINLELELDLFNSGTSATATRSGSTASSIAVSRELSTAAIAKASKDGLFAWRILVHDAQANTNSSQTGMNSTRMQVRRVEMRDSGCLNVPDALNRVLQGHANETHFEFSGICFSIVMARNPGYWSPEPHKTLRDLFSENSLPSFTNGDMLGKISKFRIAFELGQACLLLLRTAWFPRICSCHLRCARCATASENHKYDFGLHMGSVNHQAPRWVAGAIRHVGSCWGVDNYNWNSLTRPLRHLGLLLIEIVVGTPIYGITSDTSGVIESIRFMRDVSPPQPRLHSESLNQTLRRVRTAFGKGDNAEGAVRYCLTKIYPEAPTDNDMKKLLTEFYIDVVARLKDHYDERLDSGYERQKLVNIIGN